MANDISTRLVLENREYQRRLLESRQKMWEFAKGADAATRDAANAFRRMNAEVRTATATFGKATSAVRVNQSVISNAVFMVEDAASVWGTMGLAGAVRAASNNLTMMAAAFGPWAMVATVAVTTATQLYLAFNKTNKEEEKAVEAHKSAADAIRERTAAMREQLDFQRELQKATDHAESIDVGKEQGRKVNELRRSAAMIQEEITAKQREMAQLQIWLNRTREVGGNTRGYQDRLAKATQAEKELQEELLKVQNELGTAEERKAAAVAQASRIRKNENAQIVEEMKIRKEAAALEEQAKQRQAQRLEQQRRFNLAKEREAATDRLNAALDARQKVAMKEKQQQQDKLNKQQAEPASGGTRGSLEAAKAIQSFRAGNGTLNQEKLLQQAVNELRKANRKKQREVTIGVGMPGFN